MPRAASVFTGPAEMQFTRIFFFAQIVREVTSAGLETGFGDAHDIVMGNNFLRPVISHGENTAAVGHERRGRATECD